MRPKDELLVASHALSSVTGIDLLENWSWHDCISKWVLKCRLSIESSNVDLVPHQTDWYIIADTTYPNGDISIYPAKEQSITKTFQHQYYNGPGDEGLLWRKGNICVTTGIHHRGKHEYDSEPFEAETRLGWNLRRALDWLRDASRGNLAVAGDPFELPDYDTKSRRFSIVFQESSETLNAWGGKVGWCGIAHLGFLRKPENTYIVLSLNDNENKVIIEYHWNRYIRSLITEVSVGTWALLPNIIVQQPWQAPMTWDELGEVVREQGMDYTRLLARLAWPFTWCGDQFMFLGFFVPEKLGGKPKQVHWQALRFPIVDSRYYKVTNWNVQNWTSTISSDLELEIIWPCRPWWQKSENWHPNEMLNRGMFGMEITKLKIVVIGAGAIGSTVAEILVRGGVENLIIIDHEKIEVGNLSRHTLSFQDVGRTKAEALSEHLSQILPHPQIKGIAKRFENLEQSEIDTIRGCGIVMDCTGRDDVLNYLEEFSWSGEPVFCSISLGLQAKRLYILVARKGKFPRTFFIRHIEKWLLKDLNQYDGGPLPRSGGVGCWHPAFPARSDDIWLFASGGLKYIESYLHAKQDCAKLAVFEQIRDGGSFRGLKLAAEECDNG